MKTNKPLERLKHHVSGAIARGEAVAITAVVNTATVKLTDAEISAVFYDLLDKTKCGGGTSAEMSLIEKLNGALKELRR